ncbi:hypothetical protein [Thiothrix winogradskyi]|uniref:Nif11 domain-containing protein n=1 Tax=Thiothrix winogradskyi TaxID=96472 RepID=A0ABY3T6P2_9GAMM|nr:hypothetical protein [Thiothrix winogradskyi]UJS26235.1 hypothetical protein L2Y54_09410 [Thiothrix winogradskyi]
MITKQQLLQQIAESADQLRTFTSETGYSMIDLTADEALYIEKLYCDIQVNVKALAEKMASEVTA